MSVITADKRKQILEKKFGKGIIFTYTDETSKKEYERISSGSLYLDNALGGGYPRGCVIEITADAGVGKTTECLHIAAEAFNKYPDESVVFVDTENDLDFKYAKKIIGEDNFDKMLISQPETAEDTFQLIEEILRLGGVSTIFLDSLPACIVKAEIEEGTSKVAEAALLISRKLPVIRKLVKKTNTLFVICNQFRSKIDRGPVNRKHYGPEAVKYYSTVRLEMWKGNFLKQGEQPYGQEVKFKTLKNKTHVPFREGSFYLIYGEGVRLADEVLDICTATGDIIRSGAWYKLAETDENIGQGRSAVIEYLLSHEEVLDKLKEIASKTIE